MAQYLDVPVVYVAGNHEFYGHDLEAMYENLRNTAERTKGSVIFLENDTTEIAEFTIVGTTLWIDYELYNNPDQAMNDAENGLNDHRRSRDWLTETLAETDPDKTIIVTHHAPSQKSIAERFQGDKLSPAFAPSLDDFILETQPRICVHGHTHHSVDYQIGETRVVSSQRGYYGHEEGSETYRPAVIEITKNDPKS